MAGPFFRFSGFQLEPEHRALYFQGAKISVTPKEFDLLMHLVRSAGRTVTKDELIYALWPREGISDANLAQVVYRLRKTLANKEADTEFIATIPGQGYQFVADVLHAEPRAGIHELTTTLERAFQLYRNAKYLLNLRTGTSMARSIELFENAIALEPSFASAHVGVAEAYAFLAEYLYLAPGFAFPKAKAAALHALEIDPNCAEAHSALGEVLMFHERDWEAARIAYRTALTLAPYSVGARLLWAWHALFVGNGAEAIRDLKHALDIDPGSILLNTTLGVMKFYERDFEGATALLQDVLWLEPDAALAKFYLAMVQAVEGNYRAAIRALEDIAPCEYEIQSTGLLGYCYARLHDRTRALALIGFLDAPGEGRQVSNINRAIVFAGLQDTAAALKALSAAFDCCEAWLPILVIHPVFEELWGNPDFEKLRTKIRA